MDYKFRARKKGNTWSLVCEYKTADGTWKQKSKGGFSLKKEALSSDTKKALLAVIEKEGSVDKSMEGITLSAFTELYLSMRTDLSYGTKNIYRRCVQRMFDLKDMPIASIKYIDIVRQFKSITWNSSKTENLTKTVLKQIFKQAVIYKAIPESPLSEYNPVPVSAAKQDKRLRTFSDEEIQQLLQYKAIPPVMICCIMALTGMRVGEALGITWADVDFVNSSISINKQFKLKGRVDGKPKHGFGPVKNKNGNRTVHITPTLMKKLLEYKASSHVMYIDGRLTRITSASQVNSWITNHFPGHSSHDFRHTFATKLCASGENVRAIAALLGDTIATIEKTYLHFDDDMRKATIKKLDAIF